MKHFYSLLLCLFPLFMSGQNTLYVSKSGSDKNDGSSPEKALWSIAKAVEKVTPGTTVYIMPGNYDSGSSWDPVIKLPKAKSGESGKEIVFRASDPNNRPVLTSKGKGRWQCIDIQASYIVIDGLELVGGNQDFTEADSIAAYKLSKDSHDKVSGFDWNEAAKYNTNGLCIGKGGSDGGFPHHVTVRNCKVHDFPGAGISAQQADYITFENNEVYNNAWYTLYGCSGISILTPYNCDGNTDFKMFITGNTVYNNHTKIPWASTSNFRYSDGNGIIADINRKPDSGSTQEIIDKGAYKGKTLIANNVSYCNGGSGIHAFNAAHIYIVNNTAYHNEQRYTNEYGEIFSQNGADNYIYNNVMYGRSGHRCNNYFDNGGATYAGNVYFGGTVQYNGKSNRSTSDVWGDPNFVKRPASATSDADFHIQKGSMAVGLCQAYPFMPKADKDGKLRGYFNIDAGAYCLNAAVVTGEESAQKFVLHRQLRGAGKAEFNWGWATLGKGEWVRPMMPGVNPTMKYTINHNTPVTDGNFQFRATYSDLGGKWPGALNGQYQSNAAHTQSYITIKSTVTSNPYTLTDFWVVYNADAPTPRPYLDIQSVTLDQQIDISDKMHGYKAFYDADQAWEVTQGVAYIVTSTANDVINMTPIANGIIPKATPVVLYAATGNIELTETTTSATISNNLLKASNVITPKITDAYRLGEKNEEPGFYKFNNANLPANTPYLKISSQAKEIIMSFDELTSITETPTSNKRDNTVIFDIMGRRLSSLQYGINIVNGKKVLVK